MLVSIYCRILAPYLLFAVLCSACSRVQVYPDHETPKYLANDISSFNDIRDSTIKVVSFNIEKSLKVNLAIYEIMNDSSFTDLDIILLQEVDEEAVIKFSNQFRLNYLYYPIAINKADKSEFGNAILSKYKISHEDKLILPHKKQNGRIRNATNCIVNIPNHPTLVYSIHMETIIMSRAKRMDQIDAIIKDIENKKVEHIILGGDFNTIVNKDLEIIIEKFNQSDVSFDSENIGHTGSYLMGLIKPSNDHFFSRNMSVLETKKLSDSKSSDHLPILIKYRLY